MTLPHQLDRTITISRAAARIVFSLLHGQRRGWASWWGAGFHDRSPSRRQDLHPLPRWHRSPLEKSRRAPGARTDRVQLRVSSKARRFRRAGSRVDDPSRARDGDQATRLQLLHEFAEAAMREEFVQGLALSALALREHRVPTRSTRTRPRLADALVRGVGRARRGGLARREMTRIATSRGSPSVIVSAAPAAWTISCRTSPRPQAFSCPGLPPAGATAPCGSARASRWPTGVAVGGPMVRNAPRGTNVFVFGRRRKGSNRSRVSGIGRGRPRGPLLYVGGQAMTRMPTRRFGTPSTSISIGAFLVRRGLRAEDVPGDGHGDAAREGRR